MDLCVEFSAGLMLDIAACAAIPFQRFFHASYLSFNGYDSGNSSSSTSDNVDLTNERTQKERERERAKKHICFILIEYYATLYLPLSCVPYSM